MKKITLLFIAGTLLFGACNKKESSAPTTTVVTETDVLTDFVNKIALPQYLSLQTNAQALNAAVITLNTTPTDANLATAQTSWRTVRQSWETCEGFLFGPVEDNNYDPNTDTWPVDYLQIDSLMNNSASLDLSVVQGLSQSLRGYHPLEFILWGTGGSATGASLTAKQKQYMVALSQDILDNIDSLNNNWATSGGNFQQQVLTPGVGTSPRFTSKQEAILAIVGAMSDICNEVGEQASGGKIYDPYTSLDSFQTESPFSHNSMADFKNNIMGAQNVYLCKFNGQTGKSLSAFVAAKNISLDNTINQEFTDAITALSNVNVTFELAIFTQRNQLQTAMTALNKLQATLDGDLKTFIQTNVKD